MITLTKFALWILSFTLSLIVHTFLAIFDYFVTLFHLPFDIWQIIDDSITEES